MAKSTPQRSSSQVGDMELDPTGEARITKKTSGKRQAEEELDRGAGGASANEGNAGVEGEGDNEPTAKKGKAAHSASTALSVHAHQASEVVAGEDHATIPLGSSTIFTSRQGKAIPKPTSLTRVQLLFLLVQEEWFEYSTSEAPVYVARICQDFTQKPKRFEVSTLKNVLSVAGLECQYVTPLEQGTGRHWSWLLEVTAETVVKIPQVGVQQSLVHVRGDDALGYAIRFERLAVEDFKKETRWNVDYFPPRVRDTQSVLRDAASLPVNGKVFFQRVTNVEPRYAGEVFPTGYIVTGVLLYAHHFNHPYGSGRTTQSPL
ncbi:hypothetical protein CBS101457_005697 [Exobasidium rhododendri]|nr:hypothetical protein CBS101457_005695 [Exobasidium rhododendri]UZJ56376.1 hypothetical protein CBS101457_005696 [Exobasidium rhododendri]UZJ56377.1 hypothetical protein CBS101457_005697 [Exobasidium rhododendri]